MRLTHAENRIKEEYADRSAHITATEQKLLRENARFQASGFLSFLLLHTKLVNWFTFVKLSFRGGYVEFDFI